MCSNDNNCNCLRDTLCMIVNLQKQGQCIDGGIKSCDRPYLGLNNNSTYNTRPITFYTCPTNTLWSMPYTLNGATNTSSVFRIESLDDECATFRVLAPNPDQTSALPYVSTEDFFTIKLSCIGAIKCLGDTIVNGV